ncbi:MAG: iron ABC transporter [Acidobacteria bacterium]|nr:iron ABC transporter [Acidobacteriota bacterium]
MSNELTGTIKRPSHQTSGSGNETPITPSAKRSWSLRRKLIVTLSGFGGLALITLVVAPLVGPTPITLARVFDTSVPFRDNVDAQIFFIARLPRTLAGILVGASLAVAGVVFQALLRNPLATPFTLGVSAGASLGAMLVITLGLPSAVAGIPAVPIASLLGSLGAAGIVYAMATLRHRGLSTTVLLLAGVTLNSFFSALIMFVQYSSDFAQTFQTVRWLMGNLDVGGFQPILATLPLLGIAFVMFGTLPRALNLLTLGSDSAAARGVDVLRVQRVAFLSASLATGAAVSLSGPIGFIGIVIPHLIRLVVGADHRIVMPASAFLGAAFLVACDVVARSVMAPLELPVGVITALTGGPFFLWLLVRRR